MKQTQCLMRATPQEWKEFRDQAIQLAWEDTPGILERVGDNAIRCTEEDEGYWAYYEPQMNLMFLSHPANYTFVYPTE